MGSWNKTCAVSGLHIGWDRPVVLFLLGQTARKVREGYTSISTYYEPLRLPFYGTYDSYGRAENCTGVCLPYLLEALQKSLVELPQGENEYHQPAVLRSEFGIEKLFALDHQERLFINDPVQKMILASRQRFHGESGLSGSFEVTSVRPVTHVQIHREVFDAILRDYNGDSRRGHHVGFQDVVAGIPEFVAKMRQQWQEIQSLDPFQAAIQGTKFDMFDWKSPNPAFRFLSFNRARNEGLPFLIDLPEFFFNLIPQLNDEQLGEVIIEYAKGIWVDDFMESIRRPWIKQVGEGSQGQDPGPYRILTKTINGILDKEEWDDAG